MRSWASERIEDGDPLFHVPVSGLAADVARVVNGGIGRENLETSGIAIDRLARRAHTRVHILESDGSTWDDDETGSGSTNIWRAIDGMSLDFGSRAGMVRASFLGRWEDVSSPDISRRPRQAALFLDGAIVAVSPQCGVHPLDNSSTLTAAGFLYVRGLLPVGPGDHRFEVKYRNLYDATATSRPAASTRWHNRRGILLEVRA